jgi:hypothetical protein
MVCISVLAQLFDQRLVGCRSFVAQWFDSVVRGVRRVLHCLTIVCCRLWKAFQIMINVFILGGGLVFNDSAKSLLFQRWVAF